jgi:O-acetyl-ADP-ribose deacetylase (regulator of RNase III)
MAFDLIEVNVTTLSVDEVVNASHETLRQGDGICGTIHAVGPRWHGGDSGEDNLLECAYRRSLEVLVENGLKSIGFPAISTGIFGFPADRAAEIAVNTVKGFLVSHPGIDVTFCCRGDGHFARYQVLLPD